MSIYSSSPLEQLIAQINENNPRLPFAITAEAFSFGVPEAVPVTPGSGRNTRILMTPSYTRPYTGGIVLEYRRLELGVLFRGANVSVSVKSPTGRVTTAQLIEAVNTKYGTYLAASDFNDAMYSPGVLTLSALSSSLGFIGSFTLTWTLAAADPVQLASLFSADTLDYTMPNVKLVGEAALLEEINKKYATTLTLAQLTFANPNPLGSGSTYNTNVTVTSKDTARYLGSMTFRYKRFSQLALLGTGADTSPITRIAGATNTHAYLGALNTRFGLALQPRDVVARPLSSGSTTLLVEAATTSYLYLPGSSISLQLTA